MIYLNGITEGLAIDSICARDKTLQAGEELEMSIGNRYAMTGVFFDLVGELLNKPPSTAQFFLHPLCCTPLFLWMHFSKDKRVKWLNTHFDALAETAMLATSIAFASLGYRQAYAWMTAATIALGIFSRTDAAPPIVGRVCQQARKWTFVALLFRPQIYKKIWGALELLNHARSFYYSYLHKEKPGIKITLEEFQKMDAPKLKLPAGHIYQQADQGLPDLPEVDIKGFVDIAAKINWEEEENKEELIKALKSDEKWLNQGGGAFIGRDLVNDEDCKILEKDTKYAKFVRQNKDVQKHMIEYMKKALPETILRFVEKRIKASEPDYPQLIIKLKYVLKGLPLLPEAGQASLLAMLGRDGLYCGPKVVDMVNSLYQYVSVVEGGVEQETIPLKAALCKTLEDYRRDKMNKKCQKWPFAHNLHMLSLYQSISGQGYLYSHQAAQDQAIEAFDLLLLPFTGIDYYYAWRDKANTKRSYYSASEMYEDYEKNLIAILQESIGQSKLLSHHKVQTWLEEWAKREKGNLALFYDEEGAYKPAAIALMLLETGIALH